MRCVTLIIILGMGAGLYLDDRATLPPSTLTWLTWRSRSWKVSCVPRVSRDSPGL